MKKIPTKTMDTKPSAVENNQWMLPSIHLSHAALPAGKTHAIGKSHVLHVKATKTEEDERGSRYRITHVEAKPAKKKKRYSLKH